MKHQKCKTLIQNILLKLNIPVEKSDVCIARVHCGKPIDRSNGQRHIYTKFCNDKDAEDIRFKAIKYNQINKNKDFINVNQQFISSVQSRRDQAMMKRKELLKNGQAISAFIKYPATLMTRKDITSPFSVYQKF